VATVTLTEDGKGFPMRLRCLHDAKRLFLSAGIFFLANFPYAKVMEKNFFRFDDIL